MYHSTQLIRLTSCHGHGRQHAVVVITPLHSSCQFCCKVTAIKKKSSRLKRHRRFIYLFLALHIAAGSEEYQLIIQCNRSARYCLFYVLILMHYLARQDCKSGPILLYFKGVTLSLLYKQIHSQLRMLILFCTIKGKNCLIVFIFTTGKG